MGDRVLVQFKLGEQVSPAIYGHWCGSDAPWWLVDLRVLMDTRNDDLAYIAARCVQMFTGDTRQQLGVGIFNVDKELTAEDSPGDAGVFVVEIGARWKIKQFGGYSVDVPPHPHIEWLRA